MPKVSDKSEVMLEEVVQETVANARPARIWTSFEEFFHNYAQVHGVNPAWVKMAKQHVKDLGMLADQTKWHDGLKHFGI